VCSSDLPGCANSKENAVQPILTNPGLRIWNHAFVAFETATQVLRRERAVAAAPTAESATPELANVEIAPAAPPAAAPKSAPNSSPKPAAPKAPIQESPVQGPRVHDDESPTPRQDPTPPKRKRRESKG
jgi:hypothetical protein